METENIIDILQKLDNKDLDDDDIQKKENKTICRLLNIHLREFFDDIYIPYNFFRNDGWDISKILYKNEDILFYNKKYLTKEDEERFYQVFDKFIMMLEEIFSVNSKLFIYLKNWTDMSGSKWKTNGSKSYLKSILTNKKYQYISPAYTTNIFIQISKKYSNDIDKIKLEVENHLDGLIKSIRKELRLFKKIYNEIVTSYVYEYPIDTKEKNMYILGFINSIILSIMDLSEKLIELNVYAIHPIVDEIIRYYTPLDIMNQYDPLEYGGRKLYIV